MKKHIIITLGCAALQLLSVAAPAKADTINADGQVCRQYEQTFIVGNQLQNGYGTACLQSDGSWVVQQPAAIAAPQQIVVQQPVTYVVQNSPAYVGPVFPIFPFFVFGGFHYHHSRW